MTLPDIKRRLEIAAALLRRSSQGVVGDDRHWMKDCATDCEVAAAALSTAEQERDALAAQNYVLADKYLARIAALEQERDAAQRERDAWIETARMHHGNEEFYRELVTKIGEMFGPAAKTSNDGSIQQDVLALKVPELVDAALASVGVLTSRMRDCEKVVEGWAAPQTTIVAVTALHQIHKIIDDTLANLPALASSLIAEREAAILRERELCASWCELHAHVIGGELAVSIRNGCHLPEPPALRQSSVEAG